MLKIHCLLNCFAAVLREQYDYRPLFWGEWDPSLSLTDMGEITYYSADIHPRTYTDRFRYLYGDAIVEWYEYKQSKESNYEQLRSLLARQQEEHHAIVQVDLFYLPYDKRTYRKTHRPHYIFLQSSDMDWLIDDPYLGWKGTVDEETLKTSFIENSLGGGFILFPERLNAPAADRVSHVFEEMFQKGNNELARACRSVLDDIREQRKGMDMQHLTSSFSQIGIIAQRKLSYIYAFSYFGIEDISEFEIEVQQLVKAWKSMAFLAIKASMSKQETELFKLYDKVNDAEELERTIKEKLWDCYQAWRNNNG